MQFGDTTHKVGYAYDYGLFMWVNMDEEEARPFMMEALRTIRPAGE